MSKLLMHNGQYLVNSGKYVVGTTIEGQIIWDGYDDVVNLDSVPTVTGDKAVEFYVKIDPNMATTAEAGGAYPAEVLMFVQSPGSSVDCLGIWIENTGSAFYIHAHSFAQTSTNNKRTGDITSIVNEDKEILVRIVKTTNTTTSISIDGDSQSLFNSTNFGFGGIERRRIGPLIYTLNPSGVDTFLLRDIKVYDDPSGTNTLTNHWKGWPAGNTDAAWEDLVGSIDGTVSGSPAIT